MVNGQWSFESDLQVGAGMSSSTSDIISALRCVSNALNRTLSIKDITYSLLGVERSDSIFIDLPSLYLSQKQKFIDVYKPQKKIFCIYGIENKAIDTSATKSSLIQFYKENKAHYKKLGGSVREAFQHSNTYEIINNSTQSATLSQEVMPKKCFWSLHKEYKKLKADGLIVAHTGSLIGLLYAIKPREKDIFLARKYVLEQGLEARLGEIF